MDIIIFILVLLFFSILFGFVGYLLMCQTLPKLNTPWRTIEIKSGDELDYKIQQKIFGFWITTYFFAYGCKNSNDVEKSFLKKKGYKKTVKVIKEMGLIVDYKEKTN